MASCVVPTCKNSVKLKKKQDGITFHVFPGDEERKAKWTKIIRRARLDEYWKPSKGSVVCSMHFDEKYFYDTKCGLRRLKKEAFPNKNIVIAAEEPEPCTSTSKTAKREQSPAETDSEIGDVNISDLDYVFDTPKKEKERALLCRKQKLFKKHVLRIRTLQQKNRRLTKRNAALISIVEKLKKNRHVTDDIYELLSTNIVAANIFNNVFKKCILKKKKPEYNEEIKNFCITLNRLSPSAYKYVRSTFITCLPHEKTLSTWKSNMSDEPKPSDE